MQSKIPFLIVFFISVFSVVALIAGQHIVRSVKEKRRQFVIATSSILRSIEYINKNSHFAAIQTPITFSRRCTTKRQAEVTDLYKYMSDCLSENVAYYIEILEKASQNAKLYKSYNEKYNCIIDQYDAESVSYYRKYKYYRRIEIEECERIKRKPVVQISVNVEASYVSPAGRSTYRQYSTYSETQVLLCIKEIKQNESKKRQVQQQRKLMSDSLRYDVMKRDGFKCVLCGATVDDGVKLHVDHIEPISKGGKTIISNLRTLCDRCNLGKSDKFDPDGLN